MEQSPEPNYGELGLEDSALAAVLEAFASKTEEEFSILLSPVGDALGWTASVVTTSRGSLLAKASHFFPLTAVEMAISRGIANYTAIEDQLEAVNSIIDEDDE